MKTNIKIVYNGDDTILSQSYNVNFNPFKVGMVVKYQNADVSDLDCEYVITHCDNKIMSTFACESLNITYYCDKI
jgi:hypothetical protein